MDQPTPLRPAKAGLNPRDALDILDIRTRDQMKGGATELAAKTDAGADVLHYLAKHGAPEKPQALTQHECLIYSAGSRDTWQFRSGRNKWVSIRPQGRFRADNGEVLRAAALADLGIAVLPDFLVEDAIAHGALVRLLSAYPMPESSIHLLRPGGGAAPARLTALGDHLMAWFGESTR